MSALDEFKEKYSNFVKFIIDIVPDNEYVNTLKQFDALTFIAGLNDRVEKLGLIDGDDYKVMDNMYSRIIEKTGINDREINEEDILKFKRYLLYFFRVSKIII